MTLDNKLKERIIASDRKAQMELYRLCFNLLMGVAQRYKNNEEDKMSLVNNAFIKIISNLDKYKEENSFYGWAKRIIMNEVIDDFRKQKKYNELINQDHTIDNETLEEYGTAEYEHSHEELLAMLDRLPKATRNIFNLFAIDGYSHREICDKLEISLETSKWHMKEARKRLKLMLAAEKVNEA